MSLMSILLEASLEQRKEDLKNTVKWRIIKRLYIKHMINKENYFLYSLTNAE